MPGKAGDMRSLSLAVSAEGILPSNRDYHRFKGSLTTPPCSALFGRRLVVGQELGYFSWVILLYAVLSLTLIRILPVFFSFTGLRANTGGKLFIGWLGHRGLASIVFAVIVMNANEKKQEKKDIKMGNIGFFDTVKSEHVL
jgi:hypothetical protein